MLILEHQLLEGIHQVKKQFFVLCNILILIYSIYSCNDSEIVNEDELKDYAESYIEEYRNLVDEDIKPAYKKYFDFYKSYPFQIKLTLSQTSGASIEFSTSDTVTFVFETAIQRIEEHISYPHDLLYRALSPDSFIRIYREPQMYMTGKYVYMRDLKIVEEIDRYFIKVGDSTCAYFENVSIDSIDYQFLLFKGSYNPIYWGAGAVRKDVLHFFQNDFKNAFFHYIDFREFVKLPELTEIATKILEYRNDDKFDLLDLENELREMRLICLKNGIEPGFADDVYNYSEKRKDRYIEPKWYDNPYIVSTFFLIIGLIIGWIIHRRKYKKINS